MAKRSGGAEGTFVTPPTKKKIPSRGGHWSQGLLASMEDPELLVKSDDMCVVIKDAYPKSKHHYLILPKTSITNIRALNSSHVDLLKHMLKCGQSLVTELTTTNKELRFRLGYHAVPSMSRIHMHVISQDFDSPCLKNKKHWNSFTTDFFIDAEEVIEMLEKNSKVVLDTAKYEELLKQPLQCHVCQRHLHNMPQLKSHIITHK